MTRRGKVQLVLSIGLFALTLPWLWEARTCGFCGYSRYVAPWVIIGLLANSTYAVFSIARQNAPKL